MRANAKAMKTMNSISHVGEEELSCEWIDGVQIGEGDDLQNLVVQTQNKTYEIAILSGETGEILVRGGSQFPQWTAAHLSGASLAGTLLKLRGIFVGLDMEFEYDGRYVASSPVQRIGLPTPEHQI